MNLWLILLVSAAVGLSEASTKLRYDAVKAFPQPDPVTDTSRSGVWYKPSLLVSSGCEPYPAVDASGQTSAGDEDNDVTEDKCSGLDHESQIYGRALWHRDRWAIMYAWYFPQEQMKEHDDEWTYLPHDWANIVVWLNNPAVSKPTIMGVATSWPGTNYKIHKTLPPGSLDGNATRIEYNTNPDINGNLDVDVTTKTGGKFQPLIMWDQMTDAARNALNTTDFGSTAVPINDLHFKGNLDRAWLN